MSKKLRTLAVIMGVLGTLTLASAPSVSAATKAPVVKNVANTFTATTQRQGRNFKVLVEGASNHKVVVTANYYSSKGEKIDTVEKTGVTREHKYNTLVAPSTKLVEANWTLVKIIVKVDGKVVRTFQHTR